MTALTAGIGTRLAGLSAATVMIPIMIVIRPSFAGETGAYHATAIALASDILGSAFIFAIYIKHKNINLKHGGIMLDYIISMCAAGRIAAWHAANVVLGVSWAFITENGWLVSHSCGRCWSASNSTWYILPEGLRYCCSHGATL